jgi:tRNA nucleotidyltransferase/poly(A) polymerase
MPSTPCPTDSDYTNHCDVHGARRDFTVNSLFYNLNEDAVEDLTGKGLEDLRQGILRTPLPPQETFKDGEPR